MKGGGEWFGRERSGWKRGGTVGAGGGGKKWAVKGELGWGKLL